VAGDAQKAEILSALAVKQAEVEAALAKVSQVTPRIIETGEDPAICMGYRAGQ
jgi:hypothetical protein